ncbi:unnamed protein product, partial [Amoebophrya sp. A120]|eukprot:GSA120T00002469001.1
MIYEKAKTLLARTNANGLIPPSDSKLRPVPTLGSDRGVANEMRGEHTTSQCSLQPSEVATAGSSSTNNPHKGGRRCEQKDEKQALSAHLRRGGPNDRQSAALQAKVEAEKQNRMAPAVASRRSVLLLSPELDSESDAAHARKSKPSRTTFAPTAPGAPHRFSTRSTAPAGQGTSLLHSTFFRPSARPGSRLRIPNAERKSVSYHTTSPAPSQMDDRGFSKRGASAMVEKRALEHHDEDAAVVLQQGDKQRRTSAIASTATKVKHYRNRAVPLPHPAIREAAASTIQARVRGMLARKFVCFVGINKMHDRMQLHGSVDSPCLAPGHFNRAVDFSRHFRPQNQKAKEERSSSAGASAEEEREAGREDRSPGGTTSREDEAETDNKRRLAFRLTFAARRAHLQYGAAVRLQAWLRGCRARTILKNHIQQVADSQAVLVQRVVRGYLARAQLHACKHSSLTIQTAWRRFYAVRKVRRWRRGIVQLQA